MAPQQVPSATQSPDAAAARATPWSIAAFVAEWIGEDTSADADFDAERAAYLNGGGK